jgi:polyhydroxyalkanoate synthesis regulator phasin
MTNKERAPRAGRAAGRPRKHRSRPTPRWLQSSEGLEAVARARCLMVLSVLSGEKPVSDAIDEAKISRGTYYQMETRALNAMLAALSPLASAKEDGSTDLSVATARIGELEAQIQHLEQEKRRTQRLLLLTRKTIRSPVTTRRRGRPPKSALLNSTPSGKTHSRGSKTKATPQSPSTPTRAGESGP